MAFKYIDTHMSVHDGSPAMIVSTDGEQITLRNEDGYDWTDPVELWLPIEEWLKRFPSGVDTEPTVL